VKRELEVRAGNASWKCELEAREREREREMIKKKRNWMTSWSGAEAVSDRVVSANAWFQHLLK